jgi:hypothetical protein
MNGDTLYGDLEEAGASAELEHVKMLLEQKDKDIAQRDKQIADLIAQINSILDEKVTLEKNIAALYNTAILEVKRKDREIAELRGRERQRRSRSRDRNPEPR